MDDLVTVAGKKRGAQGASFLIAGNALAVAVGNPGFFHNSGVVLEYLDHFG